MNVHDDTRIDDLGVVGDPAGGPFAATVHELADFVGRHRRLLVLTGAGVSTASGIPDYRDRDGNWKRHPPVRFGEFVREERARRRYWARSLIGWRAFSAARPGPAHAALARLEARGFVQQLVTQNIDGLHQRAGSRRVIDLHGRLDAVQCLGCRSRYPRGDFQRALEQANPHFHVAAAQVAPDGDAELPGADYERFRVPGCPSCNGLLKPAVVFFGETVPRYRVQRALRQLEQAAALLVVGSSLMVYSGYRFCRVATRAGKPIGVLNLGRTRADEDPLTLRMRRECGSVLAALLGRLEA